jgi:Zn-dependent alcohol dehydrogenase
MLSRLFREGAMRAAIATEAGKPLELVNDLELRPPRAGEVRVRVHHCGLCHSDVTVRDSGMALPIVLGHEAAGVVEELGAGVPRLAVGDKVVLTPCPPCGSCYWCVRGEASLCESALGIMTNTFGDGSTGLSRRGQAVYRGLNVAAFAESTVVQANGAIQVPADTPLEVACVIGCAVQTGVGAVLNTARVRPGDTVAVVGCGGVGLNVVQGARIAGAGAIIAVDREPHKLDLARELGATHGVNAAEGGVVERVQEIVGRTGVDHAFEAIGRPATIELAIQLVGRGGQAILIGMAPPEARPAFDALTLTMEERAIRGCWYGSCRQQVDFPLMVDLYREGKLNLDRLVEPCTLDEINEAFAAMETGAVARKVIVYD